MLVSTTETDPKPDLMFRSQSQPGTTSKKGSRKSDGLTSAGGNIPPAIPPVKSPAQHSADSDPKRSPPEEGATTPKTRGCGASESPSASEPRDRVVYLLAGHGEHPGVGFAAGWVPTPVLDQFEFVKAREQLRCLALVGDACVLSNRAV